MLFNACHTINNHIEALNREDAKKESVVIMNLEKFLATLRLGVPNKGITRVCYSSPKLMPTARADFTISPSSGTSRC
jgi:hypothetical protein